MPFDIFHNYCGEKSLYLKKNTYFELLKIYKNFIGAI